MSEAIKRRDVARIARRTQVDVIEPAAKLIERERAARIRKLGRKVVAEDREAVRILEAHDRED